MKRSMRRTTAFIFALTLAATPLTFNALPVFADEAVTEQTVTASGEVTQEQVEENIIGTWIMSEKDGQPALTNVKPVFTIVSPTEAYASVSRVDPDASPWRSPSQCDISINGDIVTFTLTTNLGSTVECKFTITDINSDNFTAHLKYTRTPKNADPVVQDNDVKFVKVDDLSEAALGTWEGKCTSESSVYDDGKEHRWEYKPDGTYVYYNKVGDEWVASDNSENEYFVAGNLLCMRWVDNGTENREWWEISAKDGHMSWTALRADEDGSTFTATFEMDKVEESASEVTQEQVEENIVGSWIMAEKDGQPTLTNEKPFLNPESAELKPQKVL